MTTADPDVVLDLRRLEESSGGDRALMRELVALFLVDTDAKLGDLLAAAEGLDLDGMGRRAHGIKGSSAALGCVETAQAFRVIEELGRTGETEGLQEALAHAQAAWGRACERLRALAA
jgi:HPt (histidine-containing phosphotransfer) domain-containing protein